MHCETKSIISDFLDQISLGRTFFLNGPQVGSYSFSYYLNQSKKEKKKRPACLSALTHQWRHVSSVHLPCGDLLLSRGHSTHIESVRPANRPRPNYTWKGYRAVLHTAYPIELLLQNCGPY